MKDITIADIKENPRLILKIENPTDEMKWLVLEIEPWLISEINPTTEMIISEFKKCHYSLINLEQPLPEIPEKDILETIKNLDLWKTMKFYSEVFKKNIRINQKIAEALVKHAYYYITDECVKPFINKDLENLAKENFKAFIKKDKNPIFLFPTSISFSDEDWQYFVDNNLSLDHLIKNRKDIPLFIQKYYIDNSFYSLEKLSINNKITKEIFLYWFNKYGEEKMKFFSNDEWFKELLAQPFFEEVLEEKGFLIKYVKKPTNKLQVIAIKNNPMNLQYIQNQTEKACLLAYSLNNHVVCFIKKDTKKIREILNIKETTSKYPEEFYYVKLNRNLADEDDCIWNFIIKGNELQDFLNKTCTLSFGNLYDDNEKFLEDFLLEYKPITKEEIETLKKFGVDEIMTGYWEEID